MDIGFAMDELACLGVETYLTTGPEELGDGARSWLFTMRGRPLAERDGIRGAAASLDGSVAEGLMLLYRRLGDSEWVDKFFDRLTGVPGLPDPSTPFDIEPVMVRLAGAGLRVLLRTDAERQAEGRPHWTFVVWETADKDDDERVRFRTDARTPEECVDRCLKFLRAKGGGWEWIDEML
ncbi:hypothetical protein [Rhizohabitans arisaemae]|uniref:hypothetical protein n=1 Tax=Rhizohabitans arisaemae TaxID=2720610 RepID=UPI0024B1C810|nr:hypothetical protein [Rhizohabitans arisaemae]